MKTATERRQIDTNGSSPTKSIKLLVNIWRDNQFIRNIKLTNEKSKTLFSYQPAQKGSHLVEPDCWKQKYKGNSTDHWQWHNMSAALCGKGNGHLKHTVFDLSKLILTICRESSMQLVKINTHVCGGRNNVISQDYESVFLESRP